ncbi:MAG: CPBP family intramembrane metalloprotease [Ignavibacteria bacterium]|jgi:membrane protease YdiL (CAAX protease family)|nr:CPBP family intramembrane metalloprotease [Ignavibacteria bacterium]MCU7502908.1 CPBP family intramembrane metalloprotease [Ignavibacteria bacterium]MCU7515598.1 CPBP family intramembrane metalloprotease [Ignavibacteria bacterium]
MKTRLTFYYLLTIAFSWSIFIAVDGFLIPRQHNAGIAKLIAFYGHAAAMMGPLLAGIFVLKCSSRKTLLKMDWKLNKYYRYGLYFFFLIWFVPAIIWLQFDKFMHLNLSIDSYDLVFILSYLMIGWFAGIGEEYGWTGFILTELSEKIGTSRAVVASGILRGLWHLPLLVIPISFKFLNGKISLLQLLLLGTTFAVQLSVSNIFMSALFGYAWHKTRSIALAGWLHFQYDFCRDMALLLFAGFFNTPAFRFGWAIPFYFAAHIALTRLAREEGYSNYLEIFGKTGINGKTIP